MLSVHEAQRARLPQTTELVVLWQQPTSRAMVPVGMLSYDGRTYRFRYTPQVDTVDEFRPLLGFRDLEGSYASEELFPLFRERVLDPMRPDFDRFVDDLSLDPGSATPWEQLVRSGGASEGDTLQLTPVPRPVDEGWGCTFLAAGIRHLRTKMVRTVGGAFGPYSADELSALLDDLDADSRLSIVPEIGNAWSSDALLLCAESGSPVGYVPDWLANLTAPGLRSGIEACVKVAHVNDESAGWHLRLMVDVTVSEPFVALTSRVERALR